MRPDIRLLQLITFDSRKKASLKLQSRKTFLYRPDRVIYIIKILWALLTEVWTSNISCNYLKSIRDNCKALQSTLIYI